jgi:2'-5' RNA ligase
LTDSTITEQEMARISGQVDRFRNIRQLVNHWESPGRPRCSRGYYWFLTFEGAGALGVLVRRCQRAIALPYYDSVAEERLHLTVDRIAVEGGIAAGELHSIEMSARVRLAEIRPFWVTVCSLGGTAGAIGFNIAPRGPLLLLRGALRDATVSTFPQAQVKDGDFCPHITIAYCNSSVPAEEAIRAVELLQHLEPIVSRVTAVSMVRLERENHAYTWTTIARIPLRR